MDASWRFVHRKGWPIKPGIKQWAWEVHELHLTQTPAGTRCYVSAVISCQMLTTDSLAGNPDLKVQYAKTVLSCVVVGRHPASGWDIVQDGEHSDCPLPLVLFSSVPIHLSHLWDFQVSHRFHHQDFTVGPPHSLLSACLT